MSKRDYYEILGVSKSASADDIKKAYRRLAMKFHPDRNKDEEGDSETKFKEAKEAYEVLKDPEKRAAYDQLGADWKAGQEFRPPPDWGTGFEFSGGFRDGGTSAHSDFFDSLFGRDFQSAMGDRQTGMHAQGEDHHAKVQIDLEDAYRGASRSISLSAPELDRSGHVVTRQRTLNVKIPKGVKQGQRIRLAGQGSPGVGQGKAGDLYLEIEFKPHRRFRVEGRDVYLELPVAPWEAALGATVTAPTPDGPVDLKIPAGTTRPRKLRLKDRGIPGEPPGDLFVELVITLPPADSDAARKLYESMQHDLSYDPRSGLGA